MAANEGILAALERGDIVAGVFVDHYAVLGVPPSIGPAELRDRYMALAKLYHPDALLARGDTAGNAGRFSAITGSYAVLRDDRLRKKFDAECKLLKRIVRCTKCAGLGWLLAQRGFGGNMKQDCKECRGSGRNEKA